MTDRISEWKRIQSELAAKVKVRPMDPLPRFVAGVDCAFSADKSTIFAAALVYDRQSKVVVDRGEATAAVDVPYVPGFLSFREGPAVTAAIQSLTHPFGVICFDGQGLAHPRRCGLATHVGVQLDLPSIGSAKSRLIGTYDEPAAEAGSFSPLIDRGEQVGVVLRTRTNVNPIFVSVGHRVDLPSAIELLMSCVVRRVPEPTRLADQAVAKVKMRGNKPGTDVDLFGGA